MDKLDNTLNSPLHNYQRQFCAHIRSKGKISAPAGTSSLGMKTYRNLVHNNIQGFNDVCFPVSKKCLGSRKWKKLLDRFFSEYYSQTPYFTAIPFEFQLWLSECYQDNQDFTSELPEWLPELLHWEWVELDVSLCQADITSCLSQKTSGETPLINPSLSLHQYQWPVHLITLKKNIEKQVTWLACWRDLKQQICFAELSAASYVLLEMLKSGNNLKDSLHFLASNLQRDLTEISNFSQEIFEEFHQRQLLSLPKNERKNK